MSRLAKSRAWLFALAVLTVVPSLSAVIIEEREWHGRQIACMHGGLGFFHPKFCGTLDHAYQHVFVGTVLSVSEISDTDRQLDITQEEVFLGDYEGIVSATVNQACLTPNDPEIKPGDKWLFYLRDYQASRKDGKSARRSVPLEMQFDGPSKPLPEGQEDVDKLRRLARMTTTGILSGNLLNFVPGNDGVIRNYRIVATRQADGAQYSTRTDDGGNFEFDPLPVGTYEVTANTAEGLWAGETRKIEVPSGKCTSTQFWIETDGIISGHIGSAEKKPFIVHPWVQIVSVDSERSFSAYVDADGNFEAKGVEPGRYFVGLGIQPGTGDFSDVPVPVYFPGVQNKEQATTIQLGRAEKRGNIDFDLPAEDAVKFLKRRVIPPPDTPHTNSNIGQAPNR